MLAEEGARPHRAAGLRPRAPSTATRPGPRTSSAPPSHRPARLNVVGDLSASSWRPVRIAPGTCFSVAAGAPLPAAADVVIPPEWTDQGMAAVEIREQTKRGYGLRRTGEEIKAGTAVAGGRLDVTPALVAVLAATGVGHIVVRADTSGRGDRHRRRTGRRRPGQPARTGGGRQLARPGGGRGRGRRPRATGSVPATTTRRRSRNILDDQTGPIGPDRARTGAPATDRATWFGASSAGTVRSGSPLLSLYPCGSVGYGLVSTGRNSDVVPVICLPGDPGAALIGFEVLVRPIIQKLAGADPVFRPSVRPPAGDSRASCWGCASSGRATSSSDAAAGYTAQPLSGGRSALTSGMAVANGLIVLGSVSATAAAALYRGCADA